MDANREKATGPDGTPYMWLRHSRQFTIDGRPHTISMDVPVPVGASVEQREQLIREAEAGMEQLYRHIESRQRGQRAPESVQRPATTPQPEMRREAATTSPTPPITSQAPARETSPVIRLEDKRPVTAPPRPASSAELPDTHNLNSGSPMKLSQFITVIKENWKMTPKEAMDLLQLKSLNNMNYRELLRQIEQVVGQGLQQRSTGAPGARNQEGQPAQPGHAPRPASASAPTAPSPARAPAASVTTPAKRDSGPQPLQEARSGAQPASPAPQQTAAQKTPTGREAAQRGSSPTPAASKSEALAGPTNIPVYPLREERVREPLPVYKFDEEEDDESEMDAGEARTQNAITETMARIKIDELKEVRGNSAASAQRLTVLHNLLDSQIDTDQLEQLMSGLWNTTSDKKLRQDQVEALISWAKEDDFVDEVEAVLAVLNERY